MNESTITVKCSCDRTATLTTTGRGPVRMTVCGDRTWQCGPAVGWNCGREGHRQSAERILDEKQKVVDLAT